MFKVSFHKFFEELIGHKYTNYISAVQSVLNQFASVVLFFFYLFVSISHFFVLQGLAKIILISLAVSSSIVFFILLKFIRKSGESSEKNLKIQAAVISFILFLNSNTHIFVVGDLHHSSNVMLAVFISSFIILYPSVLRILTSLGVVMWILASKFQIHNPLFVHYSFGIIFSIIGGQGINYFLRKLIKSLFTANENLVSALEQKQNLIKDLEESRERFKNLVDASFDYILIYQNNRILDFNDNMLSFLNQERSSLLNAGMDILPDEIYNLIKDTTETQNYFPEIQIEKHDNKYYFEVYTKSIQKDGENISFLVMHDLTPRKTLEKQKEEMQQQVFELKALLPICANCKKIRNDEGYWEQVEVYISQHTHTEFSHSLCPDCLKKLYPEVAQKIINKHHNDK